MIRSTVNYAAARASYAAGLKAVPKSTTLWILASRLEEADNKSIRARALLEKARLVNPANEELWAESVGVEERSGGAVQAKAMLARGLQECPTSGILWSLSIWSEPRPMRKTRSVDALKKSADLLAIGLKLPQNAFSELMENGPHLLGPTGRLLTTKTYTLFC